MKIALIVLLVLSVFLNILLLAVQKKREVVTVIPEAEMNQIKEIAILCGVLASAVNRTSAKELLSDTKIFLLNGESYYGATLSRDDWQILNRYLYNKTKLLDTLKKQDNFLNSIRGKRILVMPNERGDK